MGNFYHQVSTFTGCVEAEHDKIEIVLSWEMEDDGIEIRIHLGPRYYTYLSCVHAEHYEFMCIKGKEIIRWKPELIERKGCYYLELQKEFEAHGLKFKPRRRDSGQYRPRGREYQGSSRGDIGTYGFYRKYHSGAMDGAEDYLDIRFAKGSHVFCGKKLVQIDTRWCGGEERSKCEVAEEALEKCVYSEKEVENFLRAFEDVNYDFFINIVGEEWEIQASHRGLVVNGADIEAPDGCRKDEFEWMIPHILDFFVSENGF